MNKITLENFRCFREKQEVRLAPLTLLVGENSTGKTSFLALIRVLWDLAFRQMAPDFKKDPYDLGSFEQIAHHRGGRGGQAVQFEAGVDFSNGEHKCNFEAVFARKGSAPVLKRMLLSDDSIWVEGVLADGEYPSLRLGSAGEKDSETIQPTRGIHFGSTSDWLIPANMWRFLTWSESKISRSNLKPPLTKKEERWMQIDSLFIGFVRGYGELRIHRPYASAPVRSKPQRTYDPARPDTDPEGEGAPMYLAHLHFRGGDKWENLKDALQKFGKQAGLFDEILVKRYGKSESEPFRLQIKKYSGKSKGPPRNLIDVGYGISQVLPVITELLRDSQTPLFLLQQPEVHLHPSAQAALGNLFCKVAEFDRQLVVETHSDYLLDRVRMDIRDGKSRLKPEDVSILFFERGNLDVKIHSLRLDSEGQFVDAPPASYRKFFMEEVNRKLKL